MTKQGWLRPDSKSFIWSDQTQTFNWSMVVKSQKRIYSQMNSHYTVTKKNTFESIGKRNPTDKVLISSLEIIHRSSGSPKENSMSAPIQSGTSPFRWSWHRKEFWRKADNNNKKTYLFSTVRQSLVQQS